MTLASGSRYRRSLLTRLLADFEVCEPGIDETALAGESGPELAARLAAAKAARVAAGRPDHIVIGSDQVAVLGQQALGKPGTEERAIGQLRACSGRELLLCTAVCVLAPGQRSALHVDYARIRFRRLDDAEIARYVARELPLDCAGSFRIEGLGISLFESLHCADPTAIQGLPLIWLAKCLRQMGLAVP